MRSRTFHESRVNPPFLALVFVIVCGLAAGSSPAQAEEQEADVPKILIVPLQRGDSVSSVVPGRVFEYFRTILAMNRKLAVLTPHQLRTAPKKVAPVVPVTDPKLLKADRLLWSGKELHSKGNYLKAGRVFKRAMRMYESSFAELVDFDKYVDAILGVALSYFDAGYDDNGEDALARVLSLRPNTILDKRKVKKSAFEALQRLQMLYSQAELGRVKVESVPTGGELYLDGVLQGTTPIEVSGMYRGKHVLRVVLDGHKSWAKTFTASAKNQTLKAKLKAVKAPKTVQKERVAPESLIDFAKSGDFGKKFHRVAKRVAKEYKLSSIVMSYVRRGPKGYELAAFVYDPALGKLAELEWVRIDKDLANMQMSLLSLEEGLLRAVSVFPRARMILSGGSKIYQPIEEKKPAAVTAALPTPSTATPPAGSTAAKPTTSGSAKPTVGVVAPSIGGSVSVTPAPGATTSGKPVPVIARPGSVSSGKPVAVITPPSGAKPVPVIALPSRPRAGLDKPMPSIVAAPALSSVGTEPGGKPKPVISAAPDSPRPVVVMPPDGGRAEPALPTVKRTAAADPTWRVYDGHGELRQAWYEKWWVWTLVGVVVAGGTTAAVLTTNEPEQAPGFRTTVTWR